MIEHENISKKDGVVRFLGSQIAALPRPCARPPTSFPLTMAPGGGPEAPPPPLPPEIEAFRKMIAACNK
jgi:hypothetical protein